MSADPASFQFPAEWMDESRRNVLFAPFRPKSLNPVAYDCKLKFWTNLIHSYCLHHCMCVISLASLKCAFSVDGKKPACLETVLDELKRNGLIVPAPVDSTEALIPEPLVPWIVKAVVKTPIVWTFSKIKSTVFYSTDDPETISYMHLPVVKEISENFYKRLPIELKGRLLTIEDVQKISPRVSSDEQLATVLRPLVQDKKAAVAVLPELAVKFSKDPKVGVQVTEVDKCVYKLEKNEKCLSDNVHELEAQIDLFIRQARECIRNGRKPMALRWLRKKKLTEKHLEQRANALDNITAILDKIRNSESDQLVLESYKMGISALKNSFADTRITADDADLTMDQLQKVLDDTREIEETISRPMEEGADIDLEAELAALQAEDDGADQPGDTSGNSMNLDHLPVVSDQPEETDKRLEERLKALAL